MAWLDCMFDRSLFNPGERISGRAITKVNGKENEGFVRKKKKALQEL